MPAYLLVRSGLPPRAIVLAPGTMIAGRSPEVELELAHVEISRQHCRFAWDGTTCTVFDLGSVCGTSVNGTRIAKVTTLQPGDKIVIGPATLEFEHGEPPQMAAVAAPRAAVMLVRGKPDDRIPVVAELIIGRDPKGDVVLADPGVSRKHASIRPKPGGGCLIADLHSRGGSFINGHRFDEAELIVGDRLQIGPFFLQYDGESLALISNASGGTLRTVGLVFRSGPQTILDDITLTIPPSRFVGIIGPSGAGKSSFLHALAGLRAPSGGNVFVDGANVYESDTVSSLGFVPQDDIVHPELTVIQALRFSARLRLPRGTPLPEMEKLITQTLEQLRLSQRANHSITRLSGGQRKRVSVGVELLAKPAILFLDEPTSGLDPSTEFQLMEVLRDLADTGCTIICTTHVMENAYLMDQLVVLVGGCLAFQGSPQEARDYFDVSKLTALYDRLEESPAKTWQQDFLTKFPNHDSAGGVEPPTIRHASKARRRLALPILLLRQWAILSSDWRNFLILLGQPLLIAALVCWASKDRNLIMFFTYLATLWFGCSNAAQEIVKEIAIYRRERLIGIGAHSYLISKFLFLIAVTILQATIIYACTLIFEGGREGSIAWQLLALVGIAAAAVGIGSAISALARSVMQAVMIVPLILIPFIIFSGKTIPPLEMEETSPNVLRLAKLTPTYSSQTVMDTSFLWHKKMTGEAMGDHRQSYSNVVSLNELELDDTEFFNEPKPAWLALLGHALWLIGSYFVAWTALRVKERR